MVRYALSWPGFIIGDTVTIGRASEALVGVDYMMQTTGVQEWHVDIMSVSVGGSSTFVTFWSCQVRVGVRVLICAWGQLEPHLTSSHLALLDQPENHTRHRPGVN